MKGFIGGASFVFDNKFVLFGDIEKLESKEKIKEHIKKYNLQLKGLKYTITEEQLNIKNEPKLKELISKNVEINNKAHIKNLQ